MCSENTREKIADQKVERRYSRKKYLARRNCLTASQGQRGAGVEVRVGVNGGRGQVAWTKRACKLASLSYESLANPDGMQENRRVLGSQTARIGAVQGWRSW